LAIDLVTGKVHALVKDRHRSCEFIEFIEFLQLLDSAYPASTATKDAPISRAVQRSDAIKSQAILGGLHHHYARI
jgi:hypothetical protein